MTHLSRHRKNGERRARETPTLALLANGSSGRWSVTLDESTQGAEECFLQIEGPFLHLFCEVGDPDVLEKLATVLNAPTKVSTEFLVGHVEQTLLRLQWDTEEESTLVFTVGPASRPVVRCSIHGQDLQALAGAAQQAALDLK